MPYVLAIRSRQTKGESCNIDRGGKVAVGKAWTVLSRDIRAQSGSLGRSFFPFFLFQIYTGPFTLRLFETGQRGHTWICLCYWPNFPQPFRPEPNPVGLKVNCIIRTSFDSSPIKPDDFKIHLYKYIYLCIYICHMAVCWSGQHLAEGQPLDHLPVSNCLKFCHRQRHVITLRIYIIVQPINQRENANLSL